MGYSTANYREQGGGVDVIGGAVIRHVVLQATSRTLTREDSDTIFIATAPDLVFTLPSTVLGFRATFVVGSGALSAGTGLSVSPATLDQIIGLGFTVADNKDAINTGATDVVGDSITVLGDGNLGFYASAVGIWAREG